jgi:hypothetical protein
VLSISRQHSLLLTMLEAREAPKPNPAPFTAALPSYRQFVLLTSIRRRRQSCTHSTTNLAKLVLVVFVLHERLRRLLLLLLVVHHMLGGRRGLEPWTRFVVVSIRLGRRLVRDHLVGRLWLILKVGWCLLVMQLSTCQSC